MKFIKIILILLLSIFQLFSCKKQSNDPLDTSSSPLQSDSNACTPLSTNDLAVPLQPPVDASTLKVDSVEPQAVSYYPNHNTMVININPTSNSDSPEPDYAKYNVCNEQGNCVSGDTGMFVQDVELPANFYGTLNVQASACALHSRRTTNAECGNPTTQTIYWAQPKLNENDPVLTYLKTQISHNIQERKDLIQGLSQSASNYLSSMQNTSQLRGDSYYITAAQNLINAQPTIASLSQPPFYETISQIQQTFSQNPQVIAPPATTPVVSDNALNLAQTSSKQMCQENLANMAQNAVNQLAALQSANQTNSTSGTSTSSSMKTSSLASSNNASLKLLDDSMHQKTTGDNGTKDVFAASGYTSDFIVKNLIGTLLPTILVTIYVYSVMTNRFLTPRQWWKSAVKNINTKGEGLIFGGKTILKALFYPSGITSAVKGISKALSQQETDDAKAVADSKEFAAAKFSGYWDAITNMEALMENAQILTRGVPSDGRDEFIKFLTGDIKNDLDPNITVVQSPQYAGETFVHGGQNIATTPKVDDRTSVDLANRSAAKRFITLKNTKHDATYVVDQEGRVYKVTSSPLIPDTKITGTNLQRLQAYQQGGARNIIFAAAPPDDPAQIKLTSVTRTGPGQGAAQPKNTIIAMDAATEFNQVAPELQAGQAANAAGRQARLAATGMITAAITASGGSVLANAPAQAPLATGFSATGTQPVHQFYLAEEIVGFEGGGSFQEFMRNVYTASADQNLVDPRTGKSWSRITGVTARYAMAGQAEIDHNITKSPPIDPATGAIDPNHSSYFKIAGAVAPVFKEVTPGAKQIDAQLKDQATNIIRDWEILSNVALTATQPPRALRAAPGDPDINDFINNRLGNPGDDIYKGYAQANGPNTTYTGEQLTTADADNFVDEIQKKYQSLSPTEKDNFIVGSPADGPAQGPNINADKQIHVRTIRAQLNKMTTRQSFVDHLLSTYDARVRKIMLDLNTRMAPTVPQNQREFAFKQIKAEISVIGTQIGILKAEQSKLTPLIDELTDLERPTSQAGAPLAAGYQPVAGTDYRYADHAKILDAGVKIREVANFAIPRADLALAHHNVTSANEHTMDDVTKFVQEKIETFHSKVKEQDIKDKNLAEFKDKAILPDGAVDSLGIGGYKIVSGIVAMALGFSTLIIMNQLVHINDSCVGASCLTDSTDPNFSPATITFQNAIIGAELTLQDLETQYKSLSQQLFSTYTSLSASASLPRNSSEPNQH